MWSKVYRLSACKNCNTNKRPEFARGLCRPCYRAWGSAHEDPSVRDRRLARRREREARKELEAPELGEITILDPIWEVYCEMTHQRIG